MSSAPTATGRAPNAALGKGEAEVELGRDHLGDECAANQRADSGLDAVPA
jgi:hypothetical protein